jgi:CheY-like chemotaxis protein
MTKPGAPILIVEDMPHIRGLLEVTLRFEGYPVVSASDGAEALELIKQQRPALIITDILMPKVDGYALVYQLRRNPETATIPVIFLSATYVTKEDKDFALSLGAMHFMEKPVDSADLFLTIGEILTNEPVVDTPILDENAFYEGYRLRLENKLRQKNQQIMRTERLLTSLAEDQKPAFEALLAENNQQREQITQELEDVLQNLKRLNQGDA